MPRAKKQAVVLVHGIGEQRPMDTVREFVKSVWLKDHRLSNTRFWNKPSEVSGSFEHRRLTTDYAKIIDDPDQSTTSRVDFYEYYWAHHTVGTTLEHLKSWFFSLVFNLPSSFPRPLQPLIYLLWGLLIAIAGIVIGFVLYEPARISASSSTFSKLVEFYHQFVSPVLLLLLSAMVAKIVHYVGDVARYITASPSNIKVRQAIRDGGVTLLDNIAATGKYQRIILVGHSLGSIIAYDILVQYWARKNKMKNALGKGMPLSDTSLAIIHQLEEMDEHPDQQRYRQLQAQLFSNLQYEAQCQSHNAWLVSDLVTLGSPLTYADFLLFRSRQEFDERKLDREYPTAPPVKENQHYYYTHGDDKFLHHGAVFSLVKWTNIYSKPFNLFGGDLVSGPVSRAFASPQLATLSDSEQQPVTPVADIDVEAAYPGRFPRLFTHTHYWRWHGSFDKGTQPEHICALRDALDFTSIKLPNSKNESDR